MNESYKPNFSPLDHEERELERLDPSSALPEEAREAILAPYRAEAKKNVTIRISENLIAELKKRAEIEGVPYQTLVTMILIKYVRGSFLERDAVSEIVKALRT
jgi:predicted DNA binding CopG/RHH family protein